MNRFEKPVERRPSLKISFIKRRLEMDYRTDKRQLFVRIDLNMVQLIRLEQAEHAGRNVISFLLNNQSAFTLMNEHNFDSLMCVKDSVELPAAIVGPTISKIQRDFMKIEVNKRHGALPLFRMIFDAKQGIRFRTATQRYFITSGQDFLAVLS
jgi:hypothetical protein